MLAGEYITNLTLREMLYSSRKSSILSLLPADFKKTVPEIEAEASRLISLLPNK